ncbi:MAG: LamG-like jellyroll fold domain-containing protein, partial [Candidatus Micrarchaeia archaeon]
MRLNLLLPAFIMLLLVQAGFSLTISDAVVSDSDNLDLTYSSDAIYNITDWRLAGSSIALLNMPFDRQVTSTSANQILDYSTNANHGQLGAGTASYAPAWTASGKVGGAYDFDGSNDRIYLDDGLLLTNSTTLSMWVKLDTAIGQGAHNYYPGLISSSALAVYDDFITFANGTGGTGRILYEDSAGTTKASSNFAKPGTGVWIHVAIAMSSTRAPTFYLNGSAVGSSSSSSYVSLNYIGRGYGGATSQGTLNGIIDEVVLFDRTLTAEQISMIFQDGLAGRHSASISSNETELGEVWSAAVTPANSSAQGTTVLSNNATIRCGTLSTANSVYTMTGNASVSGLTCLAVTVQNVTIDCAGYTMTGDNSNNTRGIYITGDNATVRNCIISNFSVGVWFNGAAGGTLINTTATSSTNFSGNNNNAIWLYNENGGSVINSTGISENKYGIIIQSMTNTSASNSQGSTFSANSGVYLLATNSVTLENVTAKSTGQHALNIQTSDLAAVLNSNANASGASGAGVRILSSNRSLLANSTFIANGGSPILITTSGDLTSNGNTAINNTLISDGGAGDLVSINVNSSSNIFCLNNFTGTTGLYVDDANGSNSFNCTYAGANQGNIWHNVMNGSVAVYGASNSSVAGLYIGTVGSGYPYNNSTAQGKLSGAVVDYAPLTTERLLVCSNLTTAGSTYTMYADASASGATCFNVQAENITLDCSGYAIIGDNSTGSYGVFSNQRNTTVKNCVISNFSDGIRLSSASVSLLQNNTISANYWLGSGIAIYATGNASARENTITSGAYSYGLSINQSQDTTVDCQGKGISAVPSVSQTNCYQETATTATGCGGWTAEAT